MDITASVPPVDKSHTYITACLCRDQSRLYIPSHLCHIVFIVLCPKSYNRVITIIADAVKDSQHYCLMPFFHFLPLNVCFLCESTHEPKYSMNAL